MATGNKKYVCYGVRRNGAKFEARLRSRHLGLFETLEEAKLAVAAVDTQQNTASLVEYKALQASVTYEEYLRKAFRYDPETGLVHRTIRRLAAAPVIRAPNGNGYVQVFVTWQGKKRQVNAHRLAYFLHEGNWPQGVIDHVNGLRSDNRWANLRHSTAQENHANKAMPTVHRNVIRFKGRYYPLFGEGFDCPYEAALVAEVA